MTTSPEPSSPRPLGVSRRPGVLAALGVLVTAALAVATNIATGSTADAASWIATVVLAILAAVIAYSASRSTTSRSPAASDVRAVGADQPTGRRTSWLALTAVACVAWLVVASTLVLTGVSRIHVSQAAEAAAPLVSARVLTAPCQSGWVVDQDPTRLSEDSTFRDGQALGMNDWKEWPAVAEGAAGPRQKVQFTVQGATGTEVTLTDLRIRETKSVDSPRAFALSSGCGSDSAYRYLVADLDQNPPVTSSEEQGDSATGVASGYAPHETRPMKFPYTVSMSDSETFEIQTNTEARDVSWVIDLSWASAGESGILTIDDKGRPFRTVGTKNSRQCSISTDTIDCS